MKNILSLISCCIIGITLMQYRVHYSDMTAGNPPLKVTEWDAFGYYAYLPAIFIYHDCKQLNWLTDIDKKYAVTGGNGWQAQKADNGNYVFKYLGGVAFMQLPLFWVGHFMAKQTGYPQDGFSPPYQYALGLGVILYCILGIFLLRKILLVFFTDLTTAIALLLVCLATNFIQYAAIDNGQSHAYIFPLYVLVLYTTMKWHQKPGVWWAALTGYIIGLAAISRPTEAIMLFIPLLWNTHTKEAAKDKWQLVKQHKPHLLFAGIALLIGVLPQLIYWKITSGSFIYDVGSKWEFLSPHFRVLFGWEKGWFIYTPVTVLFIIGMFFIKGFPFRKSVLWFCFLNIYIIIAWHDWRYGGSYSTRALVQSYPVFALPFAALIEKINSTKWRAPFYLLCAYLLLVNMFQVTQYFSTVIHYDDMNRRYYSQVYLNPNPTPIAMSLLDDNELLSSEKNYRQKVWVQTDSALKIKFPANTSATLTQSVLELPPTEISWLKIDAEVDAPGCMWQSYLDAELRVGDSVKHAKVRLFSPIAKKDKANQYAFYVSVPDYFKHSQFRLYLTSAFDFNGVVEHITITELEQ